MPTAIELDGKASKDGQKPKDSSAANDEELEKNIEKEVIKDSFGFPRVAQGRFKDDYRHQGFFSAILFGFMTRMLSNGINEPLDNDDFIQQDKKREITAAYKRYKTYSAQHPDKTIFRCILNTNKMDFFLGGLFRFLSDACGYLNPLVLRELLKLVETPDLEWSTLLKYSVGMFLLSFFLSLFSNHFFFKMMRLGLVFTSVSSNAIFEKASRLKFSVVSEQTVGKLTQDMNTHTLRFEFFIQQFHRLWSIPVQIVITFLILWDTIGSSMLYGIFVFLVVAIIQYFLSKAISKRRKASNKVADKRVDAVSEMLNTFETVRLNAWEDQYEASINKTRDEEIGLLYSMGKLSVANRFLGRSLPVIASALSFTVKALNDEALTPSVVFTTLTLFESLSFPVTFASRLVELSIDGYHSIIRLNELLQMEEVEESCCDNCLDDDVVVHVTPEEGGFTYMDNKFKLDIDINIKKGEYVGICGKVASGKTSLLNAVLGELNNTAKKVVPEKLSYVPQTPWVFNATIRNNVILTGEFDRQRFEDVLYVCGLGPDIQQLGGDLVEVGSKGVVLSGGQQQRINLARALYNDTEVYLLDDVLSAVDAHVGEHIVANVLSENGYLAEKTRVVVTHHVHYLHGCDRIIVLDEGTVSAEGTFTELMETSPLFKDLLQAEEEDDEEEEDEKMEIDVVESEDEKEIDTREWAECIGKGEKRKLVSSEGYARGKIPVHLYKLWFSYIGKALLVFFLVTVLLVPIFKLFSDKWLATWSDSYTQTTPEHGTMYYLQIYGVLIAVYLLFVFVSNTVNMKIVYHVANTLHRRLIKNIVTLTQRFFDVTPSGRILNRFGSDFTAKIDSSMNWVFNEFVRNILNILTQLSLITYVFPTFLIIVIPMTFIYWWVARRYRAGTVEIQRLTSVASSFIYSSFTELLDGLTTLRAFDMEEYLCKRHEHLLKRRETIRFMKIGAFRWSGLRLETISAFIVFVTVAFSFFFPSVSAAEAGLAISYALNCSASFGWLVLVSAELDMIFAAVERVHEYATVEGENNREGVIVNGWPNKGDIEFKNVSCRYAPELPDVLKEISFTVKHGDRVGICGRSGGSKSTLINTLMQIMPEGCIQGAIIIDGENATEMPKVQVRRAVTIIPQKPALFFASVRKNLDVFDEYDDEQLWDIIDRVGMKEYFEEREGLDSQIAESGTNLSKGQSQLLCLARALLTKKKIVLLDEATASVDFHTDMMINKVLTEDFNDCLVIKIAHRLSTLVDCNKVLVMGDGRLLEHGHPGDLLRDKQSEFFKLASSLGEHEMQQLLSMLS
ncbi:hypothetical protein PCE1_002175 [Barthelona sp. PCE]